MANTNLITVAEVVGSGIFRPTPLNARFDQQLLVGNITIAEERWLVPLLGEDLYQDMITDTIDYSANPAFVSGTLYVVTDVVNYSGFAYECIQNTTGVEQPTNTLFWSVLPKFTNTFYETLWTLYLWQYNARAVAIESADDIGVQIGANGFYLNNTETSENAGIGGIKYKTDRMREKLETLKSRIQKYLCDNKADFPLYDATKNCDCGCDGQTEKASRKFGLVITEKMEQNKWRR